MSQWNAILTDTEITAHHTMTAKFDARFANSERSFYESRSASQLSVLAAQAWNCNNPTLYQLARSYLALKESAA